LYLDYYVMIRQPIAPDIIRRRITGAYYASPLEFRNDMELMFSHAKTYNQEGSAVYDDAEAMEAAFN
ncbi:Bromodomain-containing protein, partial [Caulochytrium protostelioides]